jgi:tetratricopeptide (TPR) repeat protein
MASSARIDELRKKFDENPRRYFAPLANEYRKSGDPEQAIFICQEYLPQQPGHMSGHIVYGQALFELSRFDEARAVFETALSLDPENLIALRHLGDIARQAGDTRGARGWYQRVLEADPRNEEIAQIMLTLLATPDASMSPVSATPIATAPPIAIDASRAETPIAMPAVSSMPTPVVTPAVPAMPAPFTIEKSEDRTGLSVGPELSSLPERQTLSDEPPPLPADAVVASEAKEAPVSTWGEAPPPSADDDLLDLDDFTVGGIALSSLGAPPPAIEPLTPPPAASSAMSDTLDGFETTSLQDVDQPSAAAEPAHVGGDDGFDLGHEDGLFEADPFAIASKPDAESSVSSVAPTDAPIELASDIEIGLPADGQAGTTFSESGGERVADLESFGEAVRGAGESEPTTLEVDTFFAGMSRDTDSLVERAAETPVIESHREETPEASADPIESQRPESPTVPFEPIESRRIDTPSDSFAEIELSAESATVESPATEPSAIETPVASIVAIEPSMIETPAAAIVAIEPPVVEDVVAPVSHTDVDDVPPLPAWAALEALVEAPPSVPSEEFVTETMAELYLEQGHADSALRIYEQLVVQRPDDASLAERLQAVDAMVHGEPVEEAMPAPAGPTIREFLTGFLRLWSAAPAEPVAPAEPASSSIETPIAAPRVPTPAFEAPVIEPSPMTTPLDQFAIDAGSHASIDEEFGPPVEEPVVDSLDAMELEMPAGEPASPTPPKPTYLRGTPGSSETIRGSIDALFMGAGASTSDADAATTLSQAFGPAAAETPPAPLKGVPAHAASSELSLDHVFKTGQGRRQEAEADGFSFDQFFADELGDAAAKGGVEPSSSPETSSGPGDDIAQFNNWLNGLKKT